MSKITIPSPEVEIGGSLSSLFYNKAMLRSDVIKTNDGINAIAEDNFNLSISEVGAILAGGGETEGYLMAVKAPFALLGTNVPELLPNSTYFDGSAKTFKAWFAISAEIWKKDDNTEIIFYTNPFAGNENSYLKGSEISIINDIAGAVSILTITDAEVETATGWTKI